MAEIILSVAAKLSEYLVGPALHEGQYLFFTGKIKRNLESKKEELILTQGRVQRLVEEALNRTEEIDGAVKKWKSDVKQIIAEVEKLEQELKANSGCVRGWCPTWMRYRLCKQLAKKTVTIIQLNTNCVFCPFSHPVPLPDIEYFSSGNFMYFKSTKLASDQLLEALQDDSCCMIGLYGMGGSGKTTLVKEVGKKAKELKLFDRVVFATVSQAPNVKKIQHEIADLLGLKLYSDESEAGKARELSMRLRGREQVLVILDDVWAKLNLEDIGIPSDGNNNACKVLLTTRRLPVCNLMDCQKKIPLNLLREDEAWTLFQKHAGMDDMYLKLLNGLAEEVARECRGLHIAIEAVGTSLKGKSVDDWKVALHRLRHSKPIDVEEGVRDAFTCLQLSYDYLRSKESKLLFLMCSMFPEDHEIIVEDLFRYGVGFGLCGELDCLEIARSQVNSGINNLIDSCLLMQSEKRKDRVKMHDMVRDVALWIASKEDLTIHVNLTKDLTTLSEGGAIKECYALSSWYEEACQIPHQLDVPKLEILLLNTSWSTRSSHESFDGMRRLKVLAIKAINYFKPPFISLPQSTWSLTNLQTLCLVDWVIDDISSIVSLTRLELLDLRGSYFKLPNGIEKMSKLKLLDMSWSHIHEKNSYEVIRECSQLQEMYVYGVYSGFSIPTKPCSDIVAFPKLQRYALKIGQFTLHQSGIFPEELSSRRSLYLREINISTSAAFIKDLLCRAEEVYLGHPHGDYKNVIPKMVQAAGGMNELTKLWLDSCLQIECLIDTCSDSFQVDAVLPKLVKLILENMDNLREICHGPPLIGFFESLEEFHVKRSVKLHTVFPGDCNLCNLKILRIKSCPMLTSLFSGSVARTLVLLQELTIKECDELKCIITNAGEEITSGSSSLMFPQLKILSIGSCHKLECIFPISCVQGLVQLQEINIADAAGLKYVFGQHDHEGHLSNEIEVLLPLLKVLKLEGLTSLLSICPENYHSRWPSLTELHWVNCPKLTLSCITVGMEMRQAHPYKGQLAAATSGSQLSNEVPAISPIVSKVKEVEIQNCGVVNIFNLQSVGLDGNQQELMISRLARLRLENLHELRFISTGPPSIQTLSLQYLQHLEVYQCGRLKSIFSSVVCTISLPRLTHLIISDCEELEEIIEDNNESQTVSNAQLCFPKLKELKVLRCKKLKSLFSDTMARMLPQLKSLCIVEAVKLKNVFGRRSEDRTNNEEEIMLPNLRQIELRNLPSLIDFCQGLRFKPHPDLKLYEVIIYKCPNLASISGASLASSFQQRIKALRWTNGSQSSNEVSALIPAELNLHVLDIGKCLAANIFYHQGVESIASKLVRLNLNNLSELRSIWIGSTNFLSLPYLKDLSVSDCGKLKSVFSAVVHGSLPQLTSLYIYSCKELEEIIAENEDPHNPSNAQVCFPKLERLSVNGCHKLKSLFSTTIARMLPQLSSLCISDTTQLEKVFGRRTEDDTNNREEIVLPKLDQITLVQLPSLVHICQGSKLHAVELRRVYIDQCPKFTPILGATKVISLYLQSKEELQALLTTDGEVSHEISALQAIFNVKVQFPVNEEQGPIMASNLHDVSLKHLPDLIFIWKAPILISFEHLHSLEVFGCRRLKSIFHAPVIKSFPQLYSLSISNCEELEEIISDGDNEEVHFPNPSSSYPIQVCFLKLAFLYVRGCSKLKCLFPVSIAGHLPELFGLEITGCAQLEQVFCGVSEKQDGEMIGFVLPKLRRLELKELPSFSHICRGLESQLQLQALNSCEVKKCPNFLSTTIPALHKFIVACQSDFNADNESEDSSEEGGKEDNVDDHIGAFIANDDNRDDEDEEEDDDEEEEECEEKDDEGHDSDENVDLDGFL